MAISYKKIINGDVRYSKLNNKTWCFTLPIYNTSFINSIYVLICDIVKYILISMLDHNVELQTCLQLFNNITNKHIYRVNKWSVVDRKCKTSSFVVKFRIPNITINNLFVWNCHFIKIDAQNFGDTTDRKLYLIWAITVIIPWYWDYRKYLIIIFWLISFSSVANWKPLY